MAQKCSMQVSNSQVCPVFFSFPAESKEQNPAVQKAYIAVRNMAFRLCACGICWKRGVEKSTGMELKKWLRAHLTLGQRAALRWAEMWPFTLGAFVYVVCGFVSINAAQSVSVGIENLCVERKTAKEWGIAGQHVFRGRMWKSRGSLTRVEPSIPWPRGRSTDLRSFPALLLASSTWPVRLRET